MTLTKSQGSSLLFPVQKFELTYRERVIMLHQCTAGFELNN